MITTENADCDHSSACDLSKGLYCESVAKKCFKYLQKNDTCLYSPCAPELICNNSKCVDLPGPGEDCLLNNCNSSARCLYTTNKCMKTPAEKGGYCDEEIHIYCKSDLTCDNVNHVCIDYDGSCSESADCPNFPENICFKGKCIKAFSLKSGEECPVASMNPQASDFDGFSAIFGCEEGYACISDSDPDVGKCTKVTTKASDKKECDVDSDCAADAYCTCNYKSGSGVCVPYPYSDKKVFSNVKDFVAKYVDCEYEECIELSKEFSKFMITLEKEYTPFWPEAICYEGAAPTPTPTPSDSSVSDGSASLTVSIFAMALALLFAISF